MIEIIEQPTSFKIKCKKCGCVFQYDYTDITDSGVAYNIKCPVCHTENEHNADKKVDTLPYIPYPDSHKQRQYPFDSISVYAAPYNPYDITYDEVICKNEVSEKT